MKASAYWYLSLLLLANLLCLGCSADRDNRLLSSSSSPVSNNKRSQVSPIRKTDFGNFEYTLTKRGGITLRNGKYEGNAQSEDYPISLSHLAYGDLTRDGSEEAMVVLFEDVRGSAIPYHVFIYAVADGSPALLWSFETGDRADGGLRRIYAESGDLVIELYGKGTSIGGKLYGTEGAVCCPKFFSRTRYQWSPGGFVKKGDIEVSVNSLGSAAVIMPRN